MLIYTLLIQTQNILQYAEIYNSWTEDLEGGGGTIYIEVSLQHFNS